MSNQSLPSMAPFYPIQQPSIPAAAAAKTSTQAEKGKEKPIKRTCSVSGCSNGIVQGGVCVAHGAKRRKCQFPGCNKSSKCAGMCSKHGPRRKPCDTEGCTSISVRGTKCKIHAEPSKKCKVVGCRKAAAIDGSCKRHYDANDNGVQQEEGENPEEQANQVMPARQMGLTGAAACPTGFMLAPVVCYPTSPELCQIIAQQTVISQVGLNAASLGYPPMLATPVFVPGYLSSLSRFGIGSTTLASQRMRELSSLRGDALMMMELARQVRSNQEGQESAKSSDGDKYFPL